MCKKINLPLEELADIMRPFMLGEDKREHAWHIGYPSNLDFKKLNMEFAYHYCSGDAGLFTNERMI